MSEKAPQANNETDNGKDFFGDFEQRQQAAYREELLGDATAPDARQRYDEVLEYDKRLGEMANRDQDFDYVDEAMHGPEKDSEDSIDRTIESDARLRRAQMFADRISEIRGTKINADNEAALSQSLKDQEDKLEELLVEFSESEPTEDFPVEYTNDVKNDIYERIINSTEERKSEKATTEAPKASADDKTDKPESEQVQESKSSEASKEKSSEKAEKYSGMDLIELTRNAQKAAKNGDKESVNIISEQHKSLIDELVEGGFETRDSAKEKIKAFRESTGLDAAPKPEQPEASSDEEPQGGDTDEPDSADSKAEKEKSEKQKLYDAVNNTERSSQEDMDALDATSKELEGKSKRKLRERKLTRAVLKNAGKSFAARIKRNYRDDSTPVKKVRTPKKTK